MSGDDFTPRARAAQFLHDAAPWMAPNPYRPEHATPLLLAAVGYALLAICDELQAVTEALYDGKV